MKKLMLLFGLCILTFTCSKSEEPPAKKFNVSVSASAGGSVSTTGGQYELNEVVSITAIAADGYKFSGWSGITANANPLNVRVTSDQNITANFIKMHTLTVGVVGRGDVIQTVVNSARSDDNSSRSIVNPLKASTEYEAGKTVQLTAEEANNWLFYKWNDFIDNNPEEINGENPREIVMDKSKTVTVTFEEIIPLLDPLDSGKNNTVGKWKIRKKRPGTKRSSNSSEENCLLNAVIFRTDGSFTLITDMPLISGEYYARTHYLNSKTTMKLYQGDQQIGILRNTYLTSNTLRFNIEIFNLCSESFVGYRDPTYDEANDPLAPSNTESQAADANCVTQGSVSGNTNQTVSEGSLIQNIIWSFNTNCSQSPKVVITNLPSGVGALVQNNRVIISGTPAANTVGTYNYSVSLNIAKPTTIITGQLVVVQGATVTNTNQGGTNSTTTVGGSGGGSNNTDTTNTNSSTADTTPPAITITGNATVTIIEGASYSDAGASAIDNVDGNVTGGIKTVNSVDTSTPGNYNVLYYVDDAAGNRGFATRVVIVNAATAGIYFENGTCKCFNANVGDTATINGTLYTVVDNNTIGAQIASNNVNLCTTKVTNMSVLFPTHLDTTTRANFNTDISFWDTSNVTNMASMFESTSSFNSNISLWNVSNVSNMNGVFSGASAFNQNISTWDVSNATKMNSMFLNTSSFNQPIGGWNVGNVREMNRMFSGSTSFDQDLSDWCVVKIPNEPADFALNAPLNNAKKPVWGTCASGTSSDTTPPVISITGSASITLTEGDSYTDAGATATDDIDGDITSNIIVTSSVDTSTPGSYAVAYTVSDTAGNPATVSRIVTVQAATSTLTGIYFEDGICKCPNASVGDTATISGTTYTVVDRNALISKRNNNEDLTNVCTTLISDFSGFFDSRYNFNQDIGSWDTSNATNMDGLFWEARSFNQDISKWDVSNVTNMRFMFRGARVFNQDIGNWNVSNVTNMYGTFHGAQNFNQNIGNWNVSKVTDMKELFVLASSFNQDIGNWDVSKVTNMGGTFGGANKFNQDISNWNVSNVTTMQGMFAGTTTDFNQDIGNWDVSKVTIMTNMFNGAISFNQNLTEWCVSIFNNEPPSFSTFSGLSETNKPLWGKEFTIALTSGSQTQTVTATTAITPIQYTVSSICSGTISIGASNLPSGVSAALSNNVVTISGTPSASASGTFNYSLTVSGSTTGQTVTGTITVLDPPRTYVPDNGFEQVLIDLGYDDILDDYVLTSNIINVTRFLNQDTQNKNISNLIGIEDFLNLERLEFRNNNINSIDLSKNVKLRKIDLGQNELNSIDLSNNTLIGYGTTWSGQMADLVLDSNNLTSLNLSNLSYLYRLFIDGNNITSLQFDNTSYNNLVRIDASGLNMSSLNLSIFPNLQILKLNGSSISSLDVSQYTVNSQTGLYSLQTLNCPNLSCIKVNQTQLNNIPDGFNKDSNHFYSTDCSNLISFVNGTCVCPNANVGDTATISGTVYTVVDNSTIAAQVSISSNNVNLCTTKVTNMEMLFNSNQNFNGDISFWDTSNVTNMRNMFSNATSFNQDISNWDTSNVTNMESVFFYASAFNQNISTWDVSSVNKMNNMFEGATLFNQDISNWDVSNVTIMNGMFQTSTFNQDLSLWCVTNISSEPQNFSLGNTDFIIANKPIWGTCPDYNINVTASSNADYTLSGTDRNGAVSGDDPSITINIGDEINFIVDAANHPFYLKTVQGTGTNNLVNGVNNNGQTDGVVNWKPTAAGTYYYQCSAHNGMYGTITVN